MTTKSTIVTMMMPIWQKIGDDTYDNDDGDDDDDDKSVLKFDIIKVRLFL